MPAKSPFDEIGDGVEGMRVKTSIVPPKHDYFATLKSTNYLQNALALMDAQDSDIDQVSPNATFSWCTMGLVYADTGVRVLFPTGLSNGTYERNTPVGNLKTVAHVPNILLAGRCHEQDLSQSQRLKHFAWTCPLGTSGDCTAD